MKNLLRRRKAQGLVEYILIIALIAILVIGGIKLFGGKVKKAFKDSAETISEEVSKGIEDRNKLQDDDE